MKFKVFFSYSHDDEKYCDLLDKHFTALKRTDRIETWHDRQITPGTHLEPKIYAELDSSDIILLLISSSFVASKFCYSNEMLRAVERHKARTARVVPIMIRVVDVEGLPFAGLLRLPIDGKPINEARNKDGACFEVVEGIKKILDEEEEKAKKLKELGEELAKPEGRGDAAKQAKVLLKKGDLPGVVRILSTALEKGEIDVEKAASNHFSLALALDWQYEKPKALPHYEMAYRYRPDTFRYAFSYAKILQEQNLLAEACPIYEKGLEGLRIAAKADRSAYLPNVATTLNNLGNLYAKTQRNGDAEKAYDEALKSYRELAEANRSAYLPNVAMTLNNLGILYADTQRHGEAEKAYDEALNIRRELAEANRSAYLPDVAMTLNNLGNLYANTQRHGDAEKAYDEALKSYHELAEANRSAYLPYVAGTLNNLGNLYANTQRNGDAEKVLMESIGIRRELVKMSPQAYTHRLKMVLNSLQRLYLSQNRTEDARRIEEEINSL